jgi:hypothetical protein
VQFVQGRKFNLKPGFQRQSVWKERDRAKLIDSLLRNYPLPAIFFYRRIEKGKLVFDVIDGKQRLESIFMFTGLMRGRFWTRSQIPGSEEIGWIDWQTLQKKGLQNSIAVAVSHSVGMISRLTTCKRIARVVEASWRMQG